MLVLIVAQKDFVQLGQTKPWLNVAVRDLP